jgi:cell wall-associated NlpC family hydrolase
MIPRLSPASFKQFIGIPYDKMNCWALAKAFYSEIFDIELKHYFETVPPTKEDMKKLIYSNIGDFKKVDRPIAGDLVLIKVYGIESHIGIYLGEGYLLHTLEGSGSVIDRIAKWEKVISGYYRVGGEA